MHDWRHALANARVRLSLTARTPPVYVRADGYATLSEPPAKTIGSREHYFHFLLGYLLPLVDAARGVRGEIRVLDCGPLMTPILTETLGRLDIAYQVVPASTSPRRLFLPMWEHRADWRRLQRAADRVREAYRGAHCPGPACDGGEHLILQRSAPPAYYVDGSAEVFGYGTQRRAITNLDEITAELSRRGFEFSCYEAGSHRLGCQIRTFRNARRIFGVRGAEWANMVWCERGRTSALVAHPGEPNGFLDRLLGRYAGRHTLHPVAQRHAPFPAETVAAFFQKRT